jgi:GAF domain-containing protein
MVAKKRTAAAGPSSSKPRSADLELLYAVTREEYGRIHPRLKKLLQDVADLYAGRWPSHEACEVAYHDFSHAVDAAVAVARIAAGWNRAHPANKFDEELYCAAVAAGIFHDSGYIKDKGDREGQGGKLTDTHVQRGMELAENYLRQAGWPERAAVFVPAAMAFTDYQNERDLDHLFRDEQELAAARMIPTADLIAQIADSRYIEKIDGLFTEFSEMYEHLAQNGTPGGRTQIYQSAQEIRDGIIDFYEQFVAPRLAKFGHMDHYLTVYFGAGRNPYHENIAANLSSHLLGSRYQWHRLGDVLKGLGLINDRQLLGALERQRQVRNSGALKPDADQLKATMLLQWLNAQTTGDNLGDMLLEMDAVQPTALAHGLLQQNLPDQLLENLDTIELRTLLQISVMAQHLGRGPWMLVKIMELLNQLLSCENGSTMLATPNRNEMLIASPGGPRAGRFGSRSVPVDKGLAGWVYSNDKPAIAANVLSDQRFDSTVDAGLNSATRSLLAVPLRVNGTCLGVLEAVNKTNGSFNEHDLQILTVIANLIATALSEVSMPEKKE